MINFLFSPSHMPTCRMQWVSFDANHTDPSISQPSTTPPPPILQDVS